FAAAPGALSGAAARALAAALRGYADQTKPLVLILDDGHFADTTTLDALELATLSEVVAPLCVVGLARPVFERARPSWAERAARKQLVRLGPLDQESASRVYRELLRPAANIPTPAIERLVEMTGGVPLLMVELARGLKRAGLVRKASRGDTWQLATDEL